MSGSGRYYAIETTDGPRIPMVSVVHPTPNGASCEMHSRGATAWIVFDEDTGVVVWEVSIRS